MLRFSRPFWTPLVSAAVVLSSLFWPVSAPAAPPKPARTFHTIATFPVGGEGGWDYVTFDAKKNRLFVTRGSHVMVLDAKNGKILGDITGLSGCHGVALAPDLNKGFISNGGDNSVVVFDYKTLQVKNKTTVGMRPDAIMYEPKTRRVFTFNAQSHDATAVDAQTEAVVGTVPLGGKPESAVLDMGKVWVNVEDTSEIACFDPQILQVTRRIALAPGEEASGLAVDTKKHRLFSVCSNQKCIVVDEVTGSVVASPTIGNGPDAAAWDGDEGFASNGEDGTLSVLRETAPGVWDAQTVPTGRGARTMALDPQTHHVFLVTAKFAAPDPNAQTPAGGRAPRPKMIPGSFMLLIVGPE